MNINLNLIYSDPKCEHYQFKFVNTIALPRQEFIKGQLRRKYCDVLNLDTMDELRQWRDITIKCCQCVINKQLDIVIDTISYIFTDRKRCYIRVSNYTVKLYVTCAYCTNTVFNK